MVQQTGDRSYLALWFAVNAFVGVSIDGRGTPNRDRDWQRAVKGDFITLPMADQVAAIEALGKRLPELDLERVGIFGWSFGGYASAMAVMLRGDLFKAAIAGAPVTDWQDYDTHYTERYLGLPQETPQAYEVSNVLSYADRLERPLMIVHGTADDNVLFVHALKMSDSLFRAGKDYDFVPLAGLTHMLTNADFVDRLYGRMIAFFKQHLGSPAPKPAEPRGP
jgi:dipeptidyl-peptidase-4